jgi:hypothetical protein
MVIVRRARRPVAGKLSAAKAIYLPSTCSDRNVPNAANLIK